MHRYDYLQWFVPVLALAAAACLVALLAATVLAPGRGGRGRCGRRDRAAADRPRRLRLDDLARAGAVDVPGRRTEAVRGLGRRRAKRPRRSRSTARCSPTCESHGATKRFELMTVSAPTASSFVLMGANVAGMAGYSGVDPVARRPGPREARRTRRGTLRPARRRVLDARRQRRDEGRARRVPRARALRMAQPGPLPERAHAVRLRRARTRAGRTGLTGVPGRRAWSARAGRPRRYAATDSSRWKARANSSRSRPAAQRGTAASPSAISRRRTPPSSRSMSVSRTS